MKNLICPVCKGTGKEIHRYMRSDGEAVAEKICCNFCNGTGSVPKEEDESIWPASDIHWPTE